MRPDRTRPFHNPDPTKILHPDPQPRFCVAGIGAGTDVKPPEDEEVTAQDLQAAHEWILIIKLFRIFSKLFGFEFEMPDNSTF